MSNESFDPNAPDGYSSGRSQYISKKEVVILFCGIIAMAIILFPVYQHGRRESEKVRCIANMKAIFEAVNLYASEMDDSLPPAFRTGANNEPMPDEYTGRPWTWASDVHKYMNPRHSMRCPSAPQESVAEVEHPDGGVLEVTYGMYSAYSAYARGSIPSESVVLFAETSNGGAENTYNPHPYTDINGNVIESDGFVIGWDNSNELPDSSTRHVSRLAFPNSHNARFVERGPGRHADEIHGLLASGGLIRLKATDAQVRLVDGMPGGFWATPPGLQVRRARQ